MATITEDYVSFETAKLLKEKGFNYPTLHYYYDKDGDLVFSYNIGAGKNEFVAPTLQMAMKWLREVHNLALNVCYLLGMWSYSVYRTDVSSSGFNSEDFDTYEEACEAGIRHCLENLI